MSTTPQATSRRGFLSYLGIGAAGAAALAVVETAKPAPADAVTPGANVVNLDDFAGSTDDAKLTAMLSYAAAQSHVPYCVIGRKATFSQTQNRFPGMKLLGFWGPDIGHVNQELASGKYASFQITVNTAGRPWMASPSGTTLWDQHFANLVVKSSDGATQLYQSTTNDYSSYYGPHSIFGVKSVFGSQSECYKNTQINVCGTWQVLGIQPGGALLHVGGSDSNFWRRGSLNLGGAYNGAGKYLFTWNSQSKTNVGDVYMNENNGWCGMRILGAMTSIRFWGCELEGVNASTQAADGSIIQMETGVAQFYGCRFAFAMNNPNVNGRTTDRGIINQQGGQLHVIGGEYERATAVGETVPFLYSSGGVGSVQNLSKLGSWSGNPRIHAASGGTVHGDWTVTVS